MHNNELHQLNKCTFQYYGEKHIGQNVPVIVKKMVVLADRYEICAINYILVDNGLTTKRWRYARSINRIHFQTKTISITSIRMFMLHVINVVIGTTMQKIII